jgi:hypothetical protein
MKINLETSDASDLLGLLVAVDPGLVPQHADGGIDVSRISIADAALQLQEHVFETSGIFLAEYFDIDRWPPVHRLVISLEDRTFADPIVGRELEALGKRRQRLLLGLADEADVEPVFGYQS